MLKRLRMLVAIVAAMGTVWFAPQAPAQEQWGRDYFPNVVLRDHNGRELRFYDDIIRGKVVSINFIYTTCTELCPLDTAQLRRVQQVLGDRVGRDIHMYTISLNPTRDTPEQLRQFMRTYDVGPGWTFLTGSAADVQLLQRRLGLRPVDETNLREHDASIIMGNERTHQWIRRTAYENPNLLADLLGGRLFNYAGRGSQTRQTYAAAGEVTDRSHGYYLFRTRCQSCHTIGEGDRLGPDLAGVSRTRDPAWLTRWIREPDRMIAERDPTALALLARYRNLPMPNLSLNDAEANAIVDYLGRQDAEASSGRREGAGR
ncbi:MAG: SCO family protein [Terricaulis sp.]